MIESVRPGVGPNTTAFMPQFMPPGPAVQATAAFVFPSNGGTFLRDIAGFAKTPSGFRHCPTVQDKMGGGGKGKIVSMRMERERTEQTNPPVVSISSNDDGSIGVIDESGNAWTVKSARGAIAGDDNVSPSNQRDSVAAAEGKTQTEKPERPAIAEPERPWSIPARQELYIQSLYVMWHLSGNVDHLFEAIRLGALSLLDWRLQFIGDERTREYYMGMGSSLFKHSRLGGKLVKTREEYRDAAYELAQVIAPHMTRDMPITAWNLLRYRKPSDRVIPDKARNRVVKHLSTYMELMNAGLEALYAPGIHEVLIHPRVYGWQDKNPAGVLMLAWFIMHEMDHVASDNSASAFEGLLKTMSSSNLVNVLLNPFQEIADLLFTYLGEGAAKGVEWEFFSRIPPNARRHLLNELAGIAGFSIDEMVLMDRNDAVKSLRERYDAGEFEYRKYASIIFYRLYDAAHMSKKQYLRMIRAVDGVDWRMPFKILKDNLDIGDEEAERDNFRRAKTLLRLLLALLKLAALVYLIKKLLAHKRKAKRRPARNDMRNSFT